MKKFFIIALALLLCTVGALAEGAAYFEENGLKTCYIDEIYGIKLNDGFVFFNDTGLAAYPGDITYEVMRDETVEGKRYLDVRMSVGIYQLPAIGEDTSICVYYALYDYYTGSQFFVDAELNSTDAEMQDFTVEYDGNAWNISARVAYATLEYTNSGIAFVFDYEIVMDESYDGLVFCNAPVDDYASHEEFMAKLEENVDSGLPLIEDLGDLAYRCVYVRVR